jgi:hypothetical protein
VQERERPEHDEAPRQIAPGADPRRLYAVIAVLVGIIALLIVRPWGDGTDTPEAPPAASRSTVASGSGPAPTGPQSGSGPVGDPYAELRVTCGSPSGWRAATLQAWAGRARLIRSWIAIEPTEATGPLDPVIPFAPVATDVVTALGFCSPLDEVQRPPESTVAALWAIRGDRALPLTARLVEPSSPNALGALWGPAPEVGDRAGAWPPGRYVIELSTPTGAYHRWLGIEIEDLARRQSPSPSPPASPAGSAAPSPSPATSNQAGASSTP